MVEDRDLVGDVSSSKWIGMTKAEWVNQVVESNTLSNVHVCYHKETTGVGGSTLQLRIE